MSSFSLLKEKRFAPIFFTQFLGAFNDNVFKNALLILLTYKAVAESEAGLYANLAAGLFILPFFLFSPLAGQFCDKYEKSRLIRYVKMLEIVLMSIGALGFYFDNIELLFVSLFLMGTQSAFFGPAKYSILPQHLKEDELVAGNSLVEMGTFLAILTGTILAGIVIKYAPSQIGVVTIFIAFVGYLTSCSIPKAAATDSGLKIDWNLFRETRSLHKMCKRKRPVFLGVVAISWFWFIGSIILVQLPSLTKYFLHGDETVVTLLLAVFSLSIGLGAYICERISQDKIELGLVMLGSIGLSIFTIDIFCIDFDLAERSALSVGEIFSASVPGFYNLLFDIMMLGIFGSLYIVPLYALIQQKAEPKYRSRVIAYNNILNALFMVCSAVFCMLVFTLGATVPAVFLLIGLANIFVAFYIFLLIPEFFLKLIFWLSTVTVYSVRYKGREKIPEKGGCVVISNHVSFIDWAFIAAAAPRPMRFVMDYEYWKIKPFTYMFRAGKCIPICTSRESEEIKEMAFKLTKEALDEGAMIVVFPEGEITRDGKLAPFKRGVERMLAQHKVPVVPMVFKGLWGSWFSRFGGSAILKLPRPHRRRVEVSIGEPLSPETTASQMEEVIRDLLGEDESAARPVPKKLKFSLKRKRKSKGKVKRHH